MIDSILIVDSIQVYKIYHNVEPSSAFGISHLLNILITFSSVLIVFYINFIAFRERRKNERYYQGRLNLYNELILHRITEFVDQIFKVDIIIRDLLKAHPDQDLIQRKFEEIENIQDQFYREKMIFIQCYSKKFEEYFYNVSETYFNEVISLITNKTDLANDYKIIRTEYLTNFFKLIKKYKPLLKGKEEKIVLKWFSKQRKKYNIIE